MKNEVRIDEKSVYICHNGEIVIRPLGRIHFVKAFGRNCKVYFLAKEFVEAPIGINEFVKLLPKEHYEFSHKFWAVNLAIMRQANIVKGVIKYQGHEIPVSRLRLSKFIQAATNYNNLEK
jgi:DNA-binding LytR/AlgR family response regulator